MSLSSFDPGISNDQFGGEKNLTTSVLKSGKNTQHKAESDPKVKLKRCALILKITWLK